MKHRDRLPPASTTPRALQGPNIESYTVASWCPNQESKGPPTVVCIALHLEGGKVDLVLRLKTPARVDELIQMLLRHKRDVWPESH